jgi:hypothetical protein
MDTARADWTKEQLRCLLEQLIESTQNGQTSDGGFKKAVFTACRREISQVTGVTYTEAQIKNKVGSLKNRWSILCWLKDRSGFGWDDERKMVTATNDVWEEAIKVSLGTDFPENILTE